MTSVVETTEAAEVPSSDEAAPSRRRRWPKVDLATALQLVALVPIAATLLLVRDSSKLQWFDYWAIAPRVINPDGSLAASNLFSYHEGHILAVPSVAYWLNYRLTSGLNTTLGLFVVGISVAQLFMLRRLLPRPATIGRWLFATAFVALSALLFASQGAHNFSRAMSGTAWLLANTFVIGALLVTVLLRERPWLGLLAAAPLAVLASLSYGTGLMVWPALLVVALVLRPPRSAPTLVLAGVSAVAVGWYFVAYDRPASQSSVGIDPVQIGRRTVQVLGSALLPDGTGAVLAGALGVVLAVALGLVALRADRRAAAPWLALAAYSMLAAAMIGVARGGITSADIGTTSRYFSLSALLWSSVVGLAVVARPRDPRALAGVALAGLLGFVAGAPTVDAIRAAVHPQDELAIAMRLGVSQNYPYLFGYDRYRPLLEDLGHYPFSSDFDADCGRLGDDVGAEAERIPAGRVRGTADAIAPGYGPDAVRLTGWVSSPDVPVRCILVVDQSDRVVGAGAYGVERADLMPAGVTPTGDFNIGFQAVAPAGSWTYGVVAELEDGRLLELPEVLPSPVPPAS